MGLVAPSFLGTAQHLGFTPGSSPLPLMFGDHLGEWGLTPNPGVRVTKPSPEWSPNIRGRGLDPGVNPRCCAVPKKEGVTSPIDCDELAMLVRSWVEN